jgi:alcohol dehydrogenase class IV
MFQYNFPTRIQYGPGAIKVLPEALGDEGKKRPLIVTDRALAKLPPIARAEGVLREAGLAVATYSEIWGNPVVSQVTAGVAAFKAHQADAVVAIGGGAALDVAKTIALMAHHPGELMDYEAYNPKPRPVDQEMPLIITVPTTAGTGSEVGRSSVVSDDTTHQKKIFFSPRLLAKRVILDPELTVGLPASVTAATGMDALTHCVESFLAKGFHPMCDGIALEGLRIIAEHLPKAVDFARKIERGDQKLLTDLAHIESRGMMLNAAMMGAVAFQKDLGVTHSCAHALSTVADLHHGLANGVMIPFAMRFNKKGSEEKMAWMAVVAGAKKQTADGFIVWLEDLRGNLGIPRSLAAAGVKREQLKQLVELALADGCHQHNPRPVTAKDFETIFLEALSA